MSPGPAEDGGESGQAMNPDEAGPHLTFFAGLASWAMILSNS